jgi:hypothetical protein
MLSCSRLSLRARLSALAVKVSADGSFGRVKVYAVTIPRRSVTGT